MSEFGSDLSEHIDAHRAIAADAARRMAEQREIDNSPCPTCGGDRLRTDYTGSGSCHAPLREVTP